MASGSQWIAPPQARRDVQRLRAQSRAILTSSATVLADDPAGWAELDASTRASYPQENLRQPVRIIIDSRPGSILHHVQQRPSVDQRVPGRDSRAAACSSYYPACCRRYNGHWIWLYPSDARLGELAD